MHHLCKPGRAHIPNATYSSKGIGLLVREKKIFEGYLPYMGMAAVLVM